MKKSSICLWAGLLWSLSGCGESVSHKGYVNQADKTLFKLIHTNNLKGDPVGSKKLPSIDDNKSQLGMKLFFTKSLGGMKDSACVTCHHPMLGGGDRLSLPIGVFSDDPDILGKGRSKTVDNAMATVPRNAPSTYNVGLWKRSVFWDGRVESVAKDGKIIGIRTPDTPIGVVDVNAGKSLAVAQARFPVTSREEMRGDFEKDHNRTQARTHLAQRLNDSSAVDYIANTWQDEFDAVYGPSSVNFSNIVDAIGAYENSQVFVKNSWFDYIKGDINAISESAKRGAKLFYSSYADGGMNCVSCHSGDFFSDENFHVMAVPQVGFGKNNNDDDLGRYNVTHELTQKYAFRTPTLLNVEMTGPWGHDGAYTTLEAVVRHMINPEQAIEEYDVSLLDTNVKTDHTQENTVKALAQLHSNRAIGINKHQSMHATDEQIQDIVAFLKTLTDPCLKDRACIGKWIPPVSDGPDGLQLNAKDQNGNML